MRIFFLLITLIIVAAPAYAAEKLDNAAFQNIPVMHEGRLKPMDSFAHIMLKQISGQASLGEMSATDWLSLTLFDPQNAALIPVFKIDSAALIEKFSLTEKDLYSFTDISEGLNQTRPDIEALLAKENLDQNEQALLQLHENAATLTILMRSFSALLPLDIALPERYQDQTEDELTFTELAKIEKKLQSDIEKIVAQKGHNPNAYSPEELAIAKAGFHIQTLRAAGQNNLLLRIIPSNWEETKGEWFSPWSILLQGQGSPESAFLLSQWSDLIKAYRAQDPQLWASISSDILQETQIQNAHANVNRFALERFYRSTHPYIWVIGLYALAILASVIRVKKLPAILTLCGITLHIAAIGARIYILDRPPVGTLYESILFVTLICSTSGLWITHKKKTQTPLIAGLIATLTLLLSAPVFAPNGDNLEVLVAVLNTSFWLTTHVLVITAGYAVCILAACLAHAALYIKAFKNDNVTWLKLQQNIYHISLAALLLTAIGTILGGIWADQSWGRFWGWDPKENGALLIVLWLIWLQHGRLGNKLKPTSFIALTAALNVIVAASWFGVNLLNVGLHSYGFTDGMAEGLLAFCITEIILITTLYAAAKRKEVRA